METQPPWLSNILGNRGGDMHEFNGRTFLTFKEVQKLTSFDIHKTNYDLFPDYKYYDGWFIDIGDEEGTSRFYAKGYFTKVNSNHYNTDPAKANAIIHLFFTKSTTKPELEGQRFKALNFIVKNDTAFCPFDELMEISQKHGFELSRSDKESFELPNLRKAIVNEEEIEKLKNINSYLKKRIENLENESEPLHSKKTPNNNLKAQLDHQQEFLIRQRLEEENAELRNELTQLKKNSSQIENGCIVLPYSTPYLEAIMWASENRNNNTFNGKKEKSIKDEIIAKLDELKITANQSNYADAIRKFTKKD